MEILLSEWNVTMDYLKFTILRFQKLYHSIAAMTGYGFYATNMGRKDTTGRSSGSFWREEAFSIKGKPFIKNKTTFVPR